MTLPSAEVAERARKIRLVLLDVDGVLTDGTVHISSDGSESKPFYIRDGAAIVFAMRHELDVGFLSGRPSEATTRRAAELGVRHVSQGGPDKRQGYADILAECGCQHDEVAYMGDDVVDLPILARVGLATAPADAVEDVQSRVHWISPSAGGHGAVRELIELILRSQDKWNRLVAIFERLSRPD